MNHVQSVSRMAPAQLIDDPFKIQLANARRNVLCSIAGNNAFLNSLFKVRC